MKSLRGRIIVASVLWTGGLLFVMHLASGALQKHVPMPRGHAAVGPMLLGLALMVGGWWAARGSLAPLLGLRGKVEAVRRGVESEIGGSYPAEVEPLVESLNELIEDRRRSMERARTIAGDLAHSLKTPLAILAREAEAARAAGDSGLAERLGEQIARMSSQVDYQLARARTVVSSAAAAECCEAGECAAPLLRALGKLYAERGLELGNGIEAGTLVRVAREDLEEMLGNVLENACKWARSRVRVKAERAGGMVGLTVEDDGPGLPEEMREAVLRRGVRLDESAPGAGLGLSIVRDLAEHYGGEVGIEESEWGGAAVRLKLPVG